MTDEATPTPAKTKKQKPKSRPQRWTDAAGDALQAINTIMESIDALDEAVGELRSIQEEYEEWKDNLPESLASSPLGEKLEEVCGLEIEDLGSAVRDACEAVQGTLEEVEQIDLPRGFGKD